jgi:hypothetical protein
MKRDRGYATIALVLAAGLSSSRCECVEREQYDTTEPTSVATLTLETTTEEGMGTTTRSTDDTEDTADTSRFMGIFHAESWLTPFGYEGENGGSAKVVNVEVNVDGTASMTMETCSLPFGTIEIAWRWEAQPGPWLEFTPGTGESSLRFMAWTDVETVRATINDDCELLFEVDGEIIDSEIFRHGKACWVNRCEPTWTVHIDYCEGEEPVPCG